MMTTNAVSYPITNQDVDFFRDQGFLAVENLVPAEQLAELKDDLLKLARGGYPSDKLEPVSADMSDDEVLQRILCIHQPHWLSPVIRKYCEHPGIADVLSQIVGAHLREFFDGSVKCMQSMYFAKGPGKPGQAWHQDEIYIPTRDRSLCGAWIAIDDATVDNGCLWVLPGSHKKGVLYSQRPHGNDEFDQAEESVGFDDSAEVPVEVPAGTVVFFNGYLLHRSRKNRSDGYRRVLVNHYMSGQSFLPWGGHNNGMPVAKADDPKTFMVAGENPIPWMESDQEGEDAYLRMEKRES